jgi:hypothetical protein
MAYTIKKQVKSNRKDFWQTKSHTERCGVWRLKKIKNCASRKIKNQKTHLEKQAARPDLRLVAVLWQTNYADTPQKRGENGYHRKTHKLQTHSVLRRTEIYANAQNPK